MHRLKFQSYLAHQSVGQYIGSSLDIVGRDQQRGDVLNRPAQNRDPNLKNIRRGVSN
jgi:hypothetical protein